MNPRKLEHGFRMMNAGIPLIFLEEHEDNDVPIFWLLLYAFRIYPETRLRSQVAFHHLAICKRYLAPLGCTCSFCNHMQRNQSIWYRFMTYDMVWYELGKSGFVAPFRRFGACVKTTHTVQATLTKQTYLKNGYIRVMTTFLGWSSRKPPTTPRQPWGKLHAFSRNNRYPAAPQYPSICTLYIYTHTYTTPTHIHTHTYIYTHIYTFPYTHPQRFLNTHS